MNLAKVRGTIACLLLALTFGNTAAAQVERYLEGVHYTRIAEPAAAYDLGVEPGRKSLLEVFWYGCPHCYAFDPLLDAWVGEHANTVQFARSPIIWDAPSKQHARLFFATEALGLHQALHPRIFAEVQRKRNYLLDADAISVLFTEYGVGKDAFASAFSSFALDTRLRKTETRQRELHISSVPALIVNGTFLINNDEVATQQQMLEVAEFLLNKTGGS